jgi:hypothetical protein
LTVPAIANAAWTLTVKATGGSTTPSNTVVLSGGVSKTLVSGTSTFYPSASTTTTINIATPTTATVSIDNAAPVAATNGQKITFSSGSHSIAVVYTATAATGDISITQPTGGSISLRLPNGTFTTTGASGLPVGTTLPVTISAAASYKIVNYTINGSPSTAGVTGNTGQVLQPATPVTIVAGTNPAVSATLQFAATITPSLSLPGAGYATQPVNVSASATSNDTGLQYAFSATDGSETFSQAASATTTWSFTPTHIASYTVTLTVKSDHNATGVNTSAAIPVSSLTTYLNGQCTTCHSNSTPQVVADYNSSKHVTKQVGCQDCHVTEHTGDTATSATCENCHSATLSTTTHPVDITASKCITCHDSHNPAQGIAALEPSNHPAVTLYTFEEIGMQMAGGQKVPVQVGPDGKGMPYSPKQTCGSTAGCHVYNNADYSYDKISDTAFHSHEGRAEMMDVNNGNLLPGLHIPWVQSTAMVGKW